MQHYTLIGLRNTDHHISLTHATTDYRAKYNPWLSSFIYSIMGITFFWLQTALIEAHLLYETKCFYPDQLIASHWHLYHAYCGDWYLDFCPYLDWLSGFGCTTIYSSFPIAKLSIQEIIQHIEFLTLWCLSYESVITAISYYQGNQPKIIPDIQLEPETASENLTKKEDGTPPTTKNNTNSLESFEVIENINGLSVDKALWSTLIIVTKETTHSWVKVIIQIQVTVKSSIQVKK